MTAPGWARRRRHWFSPIALVIVGAPVPGFVFASIFRGSPQWWGLVPVAFAIVMVAALGEHRARADARRWSTPVAPVGGVYVDEGQVAYHDGTWADAPLRTQLHDLIRAGAQVPPIERARLRAQVADPAAVDRYRLESDLARDWLAHLRDVNPEAARYWAGDDDA